MSYMSRYGGATGGPSPSYETQATSSSPPQGEVSCGSSQDSIEKHPQAQRAPFPFDLNLPPESSDVDHQKSVELSADPATLDSTMTTATSPSPLRKGQKPSIVPSFDDDIPNRVRSFLQSNPGKPYLQFELARYVGASDAVSKKSVTATLWNMKHKTSASLVGGTLESEKLSDEDRWAFPEQHLRQSKKYIYIKKA